MIYFDNAATTGVKPKSVVRAVDFALENLSANPGRSGHSKSVQAAETVYKAREKLSDFFGSQGPETVVFTQNCTHAVNCVLKGLLKKGDHCIISSLEHNAVVRPLVKTGVSYSVADVSLTDDDETVKNFVEKIKPNTKLIFCTGASNVSGKILPIEKIGAICRKKGIYFGVDAAQTAGVLPIDMQKQNIDFLCIAPHKGLYAPMGIGVLIARKPLPDTIIEGGTGTNSNELFQPAFLPERLESGTVNVPGVAGIIGGLEFVKTKGTESIYQNELRLIQRLYKKLEDNEDVILYTPYPASGMYVPLLIFNVENMTSYEAASILAENKIAVRGGLHCAPFAHRQIGTMEGGAVRVAVAYFNDSSEIDYFAKTVKTKLTNKGKKTVE